MVSGHFESRGTEIDADKQFRHNQIKTVISEADKRKFEENGYLLVRGLVPESLCAEVRITISEYLSFVEQDPATWPASRGHGVINLFHSQSLWNVRQHPPVHDAFASLHGTENLWVGTDRVSFKVRDAGEPAPGPAEPVHWDGNPAMLRERSLQGLLYLTDTAEDQGAFCCVSEIYRNLDAYLVDHPEHADGRKPDVEGLELDVVGGPAGSMVIWDRRLPHSSTRNLTDRPRWVQYIALDPVGDEAARKARVLEFEAKMPPAWALRQSVPGQEIPEPGPLPELDALGRKLVGLDFW